MSCAGTLELHFFFSTQQFHCSLNDLDVHLRSQGQRKGRTCEKLHEASQMAMMVDDVREIAVKKSVMVNMNWLIICSSCLFVCLFLV